MTALDAFAWFLVALTAICVAVWAVLAWLVLSTSVAATVQLMRRKTPGR